MLLFKGTLSASQLQRFLYLNRPPFRTASTRNPLSTTASQPDQTHDAPELPPTSEKDAPVESGNVSSVSVQTDQSENLTATRDTPDSEPISRDHPTFVMQSKRRVLGSPSLPLEAVAVADHIQTAIVSTLKSFNLRPSQLRARGRLLQEFRAADTYGVTVPSRRGPPHVLPPPQYTREQAASYLATRFPGTLAATLHVLAEARRQLPGFAPHSVLDFGAGAGTGLLAAIRVLESPLFAERAKSNANHSEDDLRQCEPRMPISHAWLVDHSPPMKLIATNLINSVDALRDAVDVMQSKSLADGPPKHRRYDLVCAAYSLSEVVRSTLIKPDEESRKEVEGTANSPLGLKEKAAEARLKKLVRSLWRRTAPGGLFVAVEDGTAAGFETILFARDLILSRAGRAGQGGMSSSENESTDASDAAEAEGARVVAPCVHSKQCPLDGSVTRNRICRFVQRLNRPLFQREALPKHNGFEDEYFSYIVIQKTVGVNQDDTADDMHQHEWGRLIRAPLRSGKHITIDACTHDGKLERRTVTKKKAPEGYYARARRSLWGDIWPVPPSSTASDVNF